MEYINEVPYIDEVYRSRILAKFMGGLDQTICEMEDTIQVQKEEIRQLNHQIAEDLNKRMQDGYAMIGNALMACIDKPDINAIGPSGAVILSRIRDMQTIEQVQEYVNYLITEVKIDQ